MVADRLSRILALLAKVETTEGTDIVPTGAANAMQISNATPTPLAGQEVSRDLLLPYLGHQGVFLTNTYVQFEFDVELAGSGAAGTAPAYGPLLRMCGMSETVDAGESVAYAPESSAHPSGSLYWLEGGVRHIGVGARGTWALNLTPGQIPHLRFTMMAIKGTISDQAMPTVDLTDFIKPVPVNKANTTISLHSYSAVAESLALELGGTVTPRFLIGEEAMKITNRQATGTAVVKADTMANKNWFSIAEAHTTGTLAAAHGTVAGNICTIGAPAVQIGRPTRGETDGILNYSLPLMLIPSSGNDELTLTFT